MIFNSLDFAIFLPIVFILYWFVVNKSLTRQNILILVASYIFYGWWDWRFLFLILLSTLIDYFVGRAFLFQEDKLKRKLLLWTSIVANLGFLGFFKYYNFFLENFKTAFSFFGSPIQIDSLHIILPVGISFYTFQTLSYTIDIYKGRLTPSKNFVEFAAFVSFFPQLVAGPIERATHLLPQFSQKRSFDYLKAVDGLRQILWGLFKKVVIADNCAHFANEIFNNYETLNSSSLVLGALFFTFQIYCDFSGYSDIAIGTSRLFGFDLMQNFAFPYFSRDIAEFWRRWHISLSTWFRDYLYIPLGGSRGNTWLKIRNVFIIFLVSGFWHGANWTFIAWGFLNALYFLPLLLTKNNRSHLDTVAHGKLLPNFREFVSITITFSLTALAWIFFRSPTLHDAINYIYSIFSPSIFTFPNFEGIKKSILLIAGIIFFVLIEWTGREEHFALANLGKEWKQKYRFAFYYLLILAIFWLNGEEQEFIYFQF